MDTNEQLAGMHAEHASWQNQILGYREELENLNQDLAQMVQKSNPREISPSVEHFQNQFIRQNEVLDILRHDLKQYENKIEHAQEQKESSIDENLIKERKDNLERLQDFDRIFNELKLEFREFETSEVLQS